MTGVLVDGVRLALVLVHRGVDEVHDVRADRREEHGGELHLRDHGRPRVSVSPLAAQTQYLAFQRRRWPACLVESSPVAVWTVTTGRAAILLCDETLGAEKGVSSCDVARTTC